MQGLQDGGETRALVADIRDFLHNPAYEQDVHDAVIAAGVSERLNNTTSTAQQPQQQRPRQHAAAGTQSSAHSTISLTNTAAADQARWRDSPEQQQPAAANSSSACGSTSERAGQQSQQAAAHMAASELKQEVESLLQRTDSILSRSSGHSTLHGASASHLPGLTINTASSSPHDGYSSSMQQQQQQELGGFDFETASAALDTPTLSSKPGSREAGGYSYSGRRRSTRVTGGGGGLAESVLTLGGRVSAGSISGPPIGTSSNGSGLPVPEFAAQLGTYVQEDQQAVLGGGGGRQVVSLASRLSQQALNEIKDRLDGSGGDAFSRYSSGLSATDHTTVVLDKSASWRAHAGLGGGRHAGAAAAAGGGGAGAAAGGGAAGGGSSSSQAQPIYANFAPLEQLVDAALTDSANNANGGSVRGSISVRQGGFGGPGGPGTGLGGGGGQLSRGASGHTSSHKVALAYLLAPDYIHNTTLSRLKSELAGLSRPSHHSQQQQQGAGVKGASSTTASSTFDVKLLDLTARLSQWTQQERTSAQTFQQLLDSILDSVFARLSPSRGRLPPPPAAAPAASAVQAEGGGRKEYPAAPSATPGRQSAAVPAGRAAGTAAATTTTSTSIPSRRRSCELNTMAGTAADAAQRMSQATTRRTSRADHSGSSNGAAAAAAPKPTDSMLRTAFAKLALGQAKLRQAVGGAQAGAQAGSPKPLAAAAAQAGRALQPLVSDIGVAQRFSCSSDSGFSSRQQSHTEDALDAAAVHQIQAAMAAAAAAAAATVAAGGTPPQLPPATAVPPAAVTAARWQAVNVSSPPAAAAPAASIGWRSSVRQGGSSSSSMTAATQQYKAAAQAAVSSPASVAATRALTPAAAQRQVGSPARDCSCSCQQWLSQQQQQQQHQPMAWLQPPPSQPDAGTWQQQQQQCQQSPPAPAAAALQDAWRTTAGSSSLKPSKWSPGRDTLILARQAYKQRTQMQQAVAGSWQHWQPDAVLSADGSSTRRSLFDGTRSLQQQQQQAGCSVAAASSSPFLRQRHNHHQQLQQHQQQPLWLQQQQQPLPGGCCEAAAGARPLCSATLSPQAHSVRVSTAGPASAAGGASGSRNSSSPRRMRLPLAGGCCDVFDDAVEVHSSQHGSPILIDVLARRHA